MAIDTLNKKLALIEYGDVFQPGIPVSADGLGQADNQQLLWGYPGILWGTISKAVGKLCIAITSNAPGVAFSSSAPGVTITGTAPGITFDSEACE